MDNRNIKNQPVSQVELLKAEIAEKNRKIENLNAMLQSRDNELVDQKQALEKARQAQAKAAAAGEAVTTGGGERVTVLRKGLRDLVMAMWNRKLQHLDKRFVYKWYTELTGESFEQAQAMIRKWADGQL